MREEAAPAAKRKKLPSALDALNKATPSFLISSQQEVEEVILARGAYAAHPCACASAWSYERVGACWCLWSGGGSGATTRVRAGIGRKDWVSAECCSG